MIFLDLEGLLHVAERTLGMAPVVRDHGLLESALGRPQATVFGEDAYIGIHEKRRRSCIRWHEITRWSTATSDLHSRPRSLSTGSTAFGSRSPATRRIGL